jgi:membrane protein implicated in regulation of membrane protease activity
MSKRGWSSRVVLRYALFQIPSYLLLVLILIIARQFFNISTWVILIIIALWLTKDVFLFPSVWRAYDISTQRKVQPIIGMKGTVEKELNPSGTVKVRGELWQA